MPLIEGAFERAFKAAGLIVYLEDNVRAAIVAYLSDPAVYNAVHLVIYGREVCGTTREVLQAIGAEVSP